VPGLNTDDQLGATFSHSDGLAGPNEVTFGYAKAARKKGVVILEDTPVNAFLRDGASIRGVKTPAGELRSRRTVICAGPWAGTVASLAGFDVPIQPSRRHAFVTEKLPAITRQTPMTVDFHTSFYFHPEGDGALLGMSNPDEPPGFNAGVDWSFLDRISEVAAHRWPPLLDARVKNAWAGFYEMTPDRQPLLGPIPGNPELWMAAGFSGHGFMLAPAVGKQLASWMLQGKAPADFSAFAPERFKAGRSQPERNVI
jgi:sarcosine oxidase subunit beta